MFKNNVMYVGCHVCVRARARARVRAHACMCACTFACVVNVYKLTICAIVVL